MAFEIEKQNLSRPKSKIFTWQRDYSIKWRLSALENEISRNCYWSPALALSFTFQLHSSSDVNSLFPFVLPIDLFYASFMQPFIFSEIRTFISSSTYNVFHPHWIFHNSSTSVSCLFVSTMFVSSTSLRFCHDACEKETGISLSCDSWNKNFSEKLDSAMRTLLRVFYLFLFIRKLSETKIFYFIQILLRFSEILCVETWKTMDLYSIYYYFSRGVFLYRISLYYYLFYYYISIFCKIFWFAIFSYKIPCKRNIFL